MAKEFWNGARVLLTQDRVSTWPNMSLETSCDKSWRRTISPRRFVSGIRGLPTHHLHWGPDISLAPLCLWSYLRWLYDDQVPRSDQGFYHNAIPRDTCDLTSVTPQQAYLRQGELLYSQFYGLTKETIDAAKILPFQDRGLEELALD